jgi:KTSC domain-containing protein
MTIERKPIRRGGIRSAGYDASARLLEIEFDSGSILQYSGVGAEIARRFLTSAAPASYYKDNIEEEFPSRSLR